MFLVVAAILLTASLAPFPCSAEEEQGTAQMMERIETLVYGEPSKGGLVERLGSVEGVLFGRSLPGTIAERHAAILNFLEVGQEDQPSVLFKLGVAEWVVNKKTDASKPIKTRLEALETGLNGDIQHGQPLVMRLENVLTTLVTDPVTFRTVTLPADTVLRLRFLDTLSPGTSKAGDKVRIELTDDLVVNQCLVAPAGSLLLSDVRSVQKPRMFGVPGEVRLNFNGLQPLGPQRPQVTVGEASQKAIKEARKLGDRGEATIVGAGAASIAGAVILGPVGLLGGALIRGNSIRIPEGAITYVQTADSSGVFAYPVPESLRVGLQSIDAPEPQEAQQGAGYDPDKDLIIKRDANVFNRRPSQASGEGVELPPEQQVK